MRSGNKIIKNICPKQTRFAYLIKQTCSTARKTYTLSAAGIAYLSQKQYTCVNYSTFETELGFDKIRAERKIVGSRISEVIKDNEIVLQILVRLVTSRRAI